MQEVFEKILEKLGEEIKKNTNEDRTYRISFFGLDIAREIVKQVAKEYNDGWIPVSERLPNQDGEFTDVLITCESMVDGVFVQSAEFYIASDGEPVFDALYHYERVIAWQPLPLPYKERDSNAKV